QVGGLTPEEAERAIQATLETLSERITGGEARDIAQFLPKGMRGFLADTREEAEPFDLRSSIGAWQSARGATPAPRPPTRAPCSWLWAWPSPRASCATWR